MTLNELHADVNQLKNPDRAKNSMRFFKTGKGGYGEGDVFLGLTVPVARQLAKKYKSLPLAEIANLLRSKIHEERLIALLILVSQFEKGSPETKGKIYKFYLKNTKHINNWDLVDLTAPKIVGAYLLDRPRMLLYKLAVSKNLWERRIAIIATFQFIYVRKEYLDTFAIAELLLEDKHDLIHKSVGWMLREVGKRSAPALLEFLNKYAAIMPRTMLRYAIERLKEEKRKYYLEL